MRISELPDLFFVDASGTETRLSLRREGARIAGLAERLATTFGAGEAVGLVFRTSPDLVLWWLAALRRGLRPLVLQYPTGKQTRAYWQGSVEHTLALAGLAGVVCAPEVASRLSGSGIAIVSEPLPAERPSDEDQEIADFTIIQLSSGTTGHRKAVAFTSDALRRHAADYDRVLRLSPERDMIVSWLPLYHDMGYVACFVIPLLLGVPVTMIDPETWVKDRALLYAAIARRRGTICYMPNFGFEVMAGLPAGDLSSMRLWISCSEPVKAQTVRRFLEATGTPPEAFAACYAMAENIFAVTQGVGLATTPIDGVEVVSCGTPIPGVDLKIVEDEIWVRSPTSLKGYLGGESIVDEEGFYPTGDLGRLVEGRLHVTGRKRDLMIQAGKKFMLSDIDAAVNRILPEARGRAAALAGFDERLGTQKPIVLIEAQDFFRRDDGPAIAEAILTETGLDSVEVHFVPPRFLTKTSSGKINRVLSLEHWRARQAARVRAATDWREEIRREFKAADFHRPVGEVLDSLSSTVLAIVLADAGLKLHPGRSLQQHLDLAPPSRGEAAARKTIRIVNLADRRIFRPLREHHIATLSQSLGVPVTFEHICLPPSPILLSDLVFDDYFSPRLPDQDALVAVRRCLDKLRQASVVIIDDAAELHFSATQTYQVLSHRLERSPASDLVATRWQRYADRHHLLPTVVVSGRDLSLSQRTRSLEALCAYLDVEAFRIASVSTLSEYTQGWEYRPLHSLSGGPGIPPLMPKDFLDLFTPWLLARKDRVRLDDAGSSPPLDLTDLAHFCSHHVDQEALDIVLARYDRFCIAGRPSSVPYISKRLDALGKAYVFVPSYAPQALAAAGPFDCLLSCGPMGKFEVSVPAIPVMGTGWGNVPKNIDDPHIAELRMRAYPPSDPSGDWYASLPVGPKENASVSFHAIRQGILEQRLIAAERSKNAGKRPTDLVSDEAR